MPQKSHAIKHFVTNQLPLYIFKEEKLIQEMETQRQQLREKEQLVKELEMINATLRDEIDQLKLTAETTGL